MTFDVDGKHFGLLVINETNIPQLCLLNLLALLTSTIYHWDLLGALPIDQ
jgi:hypothetical protein